MLVVWKEKYAIGVPQVDEQHKKIFSLAEDILNLLNNDFYEDKYNSIMELVLELKSYALYHFECEEKYMKKINYSRFKEHKAQHDSFRDKVELMDLENMDEDQDEHIYSLLRFVVDWISAHILELDKTLV